jgi:hypothetical protein
MACRIAYVFWIPRMSNLEETRWASLVLLQLASQLNRP